MFFSEGTAADEETQSFAGGYSNWLLTNDGRDSNSTGDALREVRFHSDFKDAASTAGRGVGYLGRVCSSPALMTTLADERHSTIRNLSDNSTIVLKDIDVQGENNEFEDGTVIHPWTKLILLEELGTAWSWFVLLLPYVFLILAIFLDGNTRLRNTVVGPLHGKRTCAEIVGGSVLTSFDESVKGYFPLALPPILVLEKSCTQLHARWLLRTCFCHLLVFVLLLKMGRDLVVREPLRQKIFRWILINIANRPCSQIWTRDIRERTNVLW